MESISPEACNVFGISACVRNKLGSFESSSTIATATALLTFQNNFQPIESFISFISLQSSYAWYMKLSQFETVFLGLVMLHIAFLRYLEILPINVNNFFLGDPTGRRRRKRSSIAKLKKLDCDGDLFTRSLLKVLKKLDDGSCLPLTFCELESMSSGANTIVSSINRKLPEGTFALLNVLKRIARSRDKHKESQEDKPSVDHYDNDNDSYSVDVANCAVLDGLQIYENAVLLGSSVAASNYHNSTICEERYSPCPLTKQDIQHYITIMIDAKIL